jgi:hypothetical protein
MRLPLKTQRRPIENCAAIGPKLHFKSVQRLVPQQRACSTAAAAAQVLHGGANDVLWLQRDFQLYLVNIFDTEKACQVSTPLALATQCLAPPAVRRCRIWLFLLARMSARAPPAEVLGA